MQKGLGCLVYIFCRNFRLKFFRMKPLNRIFIFLLLLLSVAKPSSAGRVVTNSINRSSIREIEASIRNGDYGKVTSIVVLNRQGAILYEKYFG